jgi:hypothetical protein
MKPIAETYEYLKFGFVKTKSQRFRCPACGDILNAGPNYQPKFCGECGQKVDFEGVVYADEEFIGYDDDAFRKIVSKEAIA